MSAAYSSTYAELVADLTRDVQRAQPRDVLQYCANWFNTRLQEQRTRIRDAFQAQAFGRPSAAAGLTDELFVDRAMPPRGSVPNGLGNMSVASSVRSSPMPSHSQPHPQAQPPQPQPQPQHVAPPSVVQHHAPQPNPFALSSGSAFSLVPGARLSDPFAPTASPRARPGRAITPQRHNVIHEEEEPPTPSSPAPPAQSSSPAFLAPPPSALGRRVSVSAESITPSASGSLPPMPNYPKTPEQLQRIKASIANAFLFRNLDSEQERAVLGAMQERSVETGERVIEQGADGDYFYVVESGALDCFVKRAGENEANGVGDEVHPTFGRKVLTYTTGGTFGELALMYNAPRAATIVAIEPSTLWALDRMSFRSIILSVANRKRKMYERFLATVPLLETLDASERSRIADVLEPRTYNEGDSVVEEGDPGNEFFIIESGEATAFKRVKGEDGELRDDVVMKYGPGDFFGELALLHRAPRAATVRASVRTSDSDGPPSKLKVAVLDAQAFTRLLGNLKSLLDRHASQHYGATLRHN